VDGLMHVPKGHPSDASTGLGWLIYAALMLSVSATVNIVWGVIALADNYYWGGDFAASGHPELLGWLWIGVGLFELAVAGLVLVKSGLGLILGIFIATANIVMHLSVVDAHPGWALVAMSANVLVIYALVKPWWTGE